MRWFVYLLRCRDGTLYTGVTTDPRRRLREHNAGRGARYTSGRRPVRLIHVEVAAGRSAALRREWSIKQWPRDRKLRLARVVAAASPGSRRSGRAAQGEAGP